VGPKISIWAARVLFPGGCLRLVSTAQKRLAGPSKRSMYCLRSRGPGGMRRRLWLRLLLLDGTLEEAARWCRLGMRTRRSLAAAEHVEGKVWKDILPAEKKKKKEKGKAVLLCRSGKM